MYAEKNSYNLLGQFRRNTISIVYAFLISLIKTQWEKLRDRHHLVCTLSP
jgi:hypothetical protein